MKTLYLECNSGISGDMTVAALLDLGADEKALMNALKSLNVSGYTINTGRVKKCGITAFDFDVILDGHEPDEHSHSKHEHEHSHEHEDSHGEHGHSHEHEHDCHEHSHKHIHSGHDLSHSHDGHDHPNGHERQHEHNHSHAHRGINEITAIIDNASISENAKAIAKRAFDIVAEAEAKVHGMPKNEVHFHEVGAVDSIVDIISAAVCLDNLGIESVIATPLSEGSGTVWCQHGRVPVPAPATLEIAKTHQIPLNITKNNGEMVTPTGIAIIAALSCRFDFTGSMRILKTGYGAGKKDFAVANVLRASIVETSAASSSGDDFPRDEVFELKCNIDDMTGEQIASVCETLMENGALDVWLTPVIMKKGRPAQILSLLCETGSKARFEELLFIHTTTLGIRAAAFSRAKLNRRPSAVNTGYGVLDTKEASAKNICKTSIEYESAKKISKAGNIPLIEVYRAGESAIQNQK